MNIGKLGGKLTSIGLALEAGLFLLRVGKAVVREIKGRKVPGTPIEKEADDGRV